MRLIWGDTLLMLNLALHIIHFVRWLHIKRNRLTSQGLHKNLHSSTKMEYEMQRGFLIYILIRQFVTMLELLSCTDDTLLIWENVLLIFYLGLHIGNCVRWIYIKRNGLTNQGLHKNLESNSKFPEKIQISENIFCTRIFGLKYDIV